MGQYKHPRKPKVKFMYTDFAGKIRLFLWETQLFPKKSRYFRQNFRRHFISRQPWFSNFHPDVLIFWEKTQGVATLHFTGWLVLCSFWTRMMIIIIRPSWRRWVRRDYFLCRVCPRLFGMPIAPSVAGQAGVSIPSKAMIYISLRPCLYY